MQTPKMKSDCADLDQSRKSRGKLKIQPLSGSMVFPLWLVIAAWLITNTGKKELAAVITPGRHAWRKKA